MGGFFFIRSFESMMLHALRIQHAQHVADNAALSGGIHSLQYQQDRRGLASGN